MLWYRGYIVSAVPECPFFKSIACDASNKIGWHEKLATNLLLLISNLLR